MSPTLVEKIASAVLYEGYILYPYRASSVKNQQRFNFGVLAPQSYSQAQGGYEACSMQTECLVLGNSETVVQVRPRFLHLMMREIFKSPSSRGQSVEPALQFVDSLEVDGSLFQTWQEAVERELELRFLRPERLSISRAKSIFHCRHRKTQKH